MTQHQESSISKTTILPEKKSKASSVMFNIIARQSTSREKYSSFCYFVLADDITQSTGKPFGMYSSVKITTRLCAVHCNLQIIFQLSNAI